MKKIFLLAGAFISFCQMSDAQRTYVNKEWQNDNSQQTSTIQRTVSKLDHQKNLVVLGNLFNSNVGSIDVHLKKVDPDGNIIWERFYNGNQNLEDIGIDFTIDQFNNIVVIANIGTGNGIDIGLIKYSENGNLLWDTSWNSPNNQSDVPLKIDVDFDDAIYIAGGSEDAQGLSDYIVLKYNYSGQLLWENTYDHIGLHDVATGLSIINSSSIAVSGASASSNSEWDFATLKIDSSGVSTDTVRTEIPGVGLDKVVGVETDVNNNVYVYGTTGQSGNRNVQIVKFNSDFQFEWVQSYNSGGDDIARSFDIDNNGNIYILETSIGSNGSEFITLKYTNAGVLSWKRGYNAGDETNYADGVMISVDDEFVTIAGNVKENSNENFVVIRYTLDGKINLEKKYDSGSSNDQLKSMSVDGNDIYVNGITDNGGTSINREIKYSVVNKEDVVFYENGEASHVKNELIIKFRPSYVNSSSIDNKELEVGSLREFVSQEVISELNEYTSRDWSNYRTFKIFRKLTTADNTSVTRLGEVVEIPEFWSTLLVEIPENNSSSLQISAQNTDQLDQLISAISMNCRTVRYAEKNVLRTQQSIPDDTYFLNSQSGLENYSYGINAVDAWDKQVGNSAIKVGIFDNAVNWQHEDFGNGTYAGSKIAGGWNYVTNSHISTTTDYGNHGTACAGIIGAIRNNDKGIAGIAGGDAINGNTGVQLFSMVIDDHTLPSGEPSFEPTSVIANAIVEGAVENPNTGYGYGLHVQNHSWSGGTAAMIERDALNECFKNHCAFVASSGNTYGTHVRYPASYRDEWAMKTGANDASGDRADFSTYANGLDFVAPGTPDIYKTLDGNDNSGYAYNGQGTSFAAPHVAGTSALMLSQHRPDANILYPNKLSPEDIEHILQKTAEDIDFNPPFTTNYDDETGYGIINAANAVKNVSLPYRIHHLEATVSTSGANLIESNQVIQFPTGVPGYNFPTAMYIGSSDVYEFTVTIPHSLPASESFVDGWVRNSSSELYGYVSTIADPHWAGVKMISCDQNSATFKGYFYKVHMVNILGQNLGSYWVPNGSGTDAKFAYSIQTLDQNPNISIEEFESEASEINVFPNPTYNNITLTVDNCSSKLKEIKLVDITGKVINVKWNIKNSSGACEYVIDLSGVKSGMYFIEVQSENRIIHKKVIKK